MVETDGAFRLTFVEGRGLLTLTGRDIPELGRVDRVELEIPNLRFPVDVSGGVTRFKNRRLKLRSVAVSFTADDMAGFLRGGRLADFGITNPRVEIDGGLVRMAARAAVGGREAEFTLLAALVLEPPRVARLVVFDLRVYGFLPVPAPALVTALGTALGAAPADKMRGDGNGLAPLLRLRSPAELEIDLLDLALLALLPMYGWRLPERRHVGAAALRAGGDRLKVWFGESADAFPALELGPELRERVADHASLRERVGAAEQALLAGDMVRAVEGYRAAAPLESNDRAASERLLCLLAAKSQTLSDADELAAAALDRWPDCTPAWLVRAMAAAERDRPAEAAGIYERLGERARREGSLADRSSALLAAAPLWARAGDESRALSALENALADRPQLGAGVRALARRLGEEGRWDDIAPLLARRAGDGEAMPGEEDTAAIVELAEMASASGDQALCYRAVEALDALLSREEWPDPAVPRAEAARQMALLSEALGDETTALEWLRDCLEGEAPGPVALLAWRQVVRLLVQRQDWAAAAGVLAAWAEDVRTGESGLQRSVHLSESASILHEQLGRGDEALAALESALRLAPDSRAALEALDALALATGNWSAIAECLRRRLAEVRPDAGRHLLHRLATVLGERLGRHDDAIESYRLLLDLDSGDVGARLGMARLCWQVGMHDESAAAYRELLALAPCPPAVAGEARLRLAQSAKLAGDDDTAGRELAGALAGELDGVPLVVLVESLQALGSTAELCERLALREQVSPSGPEQLEVTRALATALEHAGRRAEAEAAHRRVLEQAPEDERALLFLSGQHEETDVDEAELLQRLDRQPGSAEDVALLVERARRRAARPRGESSALMMLQVLQPGSLPPEALGMRAELAERSGDMADALACWRALRGLAGDDREALAVVDRRLAALVSRPDMPVEAALAELEQLHDASPADMAIGEALFRAYGRLEDRDAADRARASLLERVPGLPPPCHAAVHLGRAESAERLGELDTAEHELEQARACDDSSEARADQLALAARLSMARGQLAEAQVQLEEAMALVPEHAGALACMAELAYRGQEWERARSLYARLARIADVGRVLGRDVLAFRRAELAEMFGDRAEAERAFGEVAELDPGHAGAREALAGFALMRGDLAAAAARLEEVLERLPRDAVARLTEVRQRLGEIYLGLGQLAPARHNLEMALASDPDGIAPLDLLISTYERMGLHREAAAACERLARSLPEPARKAEALFRQGEILRTALGDHEAANDAYLRASDLDPTAAPTLARLVVYYWEQGDWANLCEVGRDLLAQGQPARAGEEELPLLIALGTLVRSEDEERARGLLAGTTFDAGVLALRLGELAEHLTRAGGELPEALLGCVLATATPGFEAELRATVLRSVLGDPADLGQVLLLAQLLARQGEPALARAARDLALFIDPELVLGGRLADLEAEAAALPAAFVAGRAEHPLCRGPLRRVLRALAPALAALPQSSGASVEGAPLSAEAEAAFQELRTRLQAPAMRARVHGEGTEVTFAAVQPLTLVLGRRAERLARPELDFLLARALEQARAGTLAVARLSVGDLRGLLRGVIRAVSLQSGESDGEQDPEGERASAWAARLSAPEVARLMPEGKEGADLLLEAGEALARPPDLEGYVRGCRFTADRIGLLACGSPLVALRSLAAALKAPEPAVGQGLSIQRQEQVRSSAALRELVAFMLSEEYAASIAPA